MAYETPITIAEAIKRIKKGYYVLPAIQREFVWSADQIEILFDSLMRKYPIGTFLFWEIDSAKIEDLQFYQFLEEYNALNSHHNLRANLEGKESVVAVLDGQQRLTSLYIALTGSYAYKLPRKSNDNPRSYPERKLYLNLLRTFKGSESELESETEYESQMEYEFRFLTKEEASVEDKDVHWFDCHKVLPSKDKSAMLRYLIESGLSDTSRYDQEKVNFALDTLSRFHDVVHEHGTISSYQEKDEDLDKVLQIFIRINREGTKLNYADMLLSIVTAQWENKKDAREIIHEFVDEINEIGDGFKFEKNLVLKSCLVLSDLNVKFEVDNFTKKNMKTIESKWDDISSSLRIAIELISKFGYRAENLISKNAVIPIAYFIYRRECGDDILHKGRWEESRSSIKKWLARSFLSGAFGFAQDAIYPKMRDLINENPGHFPLEAIIAHYKGGNRSISFNKDEINNLLGLQYKNSKTHSALTLLYPALDYHFRYDKDHIHPKSRFDKRIMQESGFSDEDIEKFRAEMNSIANLQLLEATDDQEKSNKPLKEWLEEKYPDERARKNYLTQNYIPLDQSLEFKDFLDFIDKRKEKIKKEFISVLGVTDEEIEGE